MQKQASVLCSAKKTWTLSGISERSKLGTESSNSEKPQPRAKWS